MHRPKHKHRLRRKPEARDLSGDIRIVGAVDGSEKSSEALSVVVAFGRPSSTFRDPNTSSKKRLHIFDGKSAMEVEDKIERESWYGSTDKSIPDSIRSSVILKSSLRCGTRHPAERLKEENRNPHLTLNS